MSAVLGGGARVRKSTATVTKKPSTVLKREHVRRPHSCGEEKTVSVNKAWIDCTYSKRKAGSMNGFRVAMRGTGNQVKRREKKARSEARSE